MTDNKENLNNTTDLEQNDPNQGELFTTNESYENKNHTTRDDILEPEDQKEEVNTKKFDYPSFEDVFPEEDNESAKTLPHRYKVVRGDTIRTIAARFGISPGYLSAINNLEDPNTLRNGSVLRLSKEEPSDETEKE